jgi:hypothetical protein
MALPSSSARLRLGKRLILKTSIIPGSRGSRGVTTFILAPPSFCKHFPSDRFPLFLEKIALRRIAIATLVPTGSGAALRKRFSVRIDILKQFSEVSLLNP